MEKEKQQLIQSFRIPAIACLLLWLIHTVQYLRGWEWGFLGVYPREISGLIGILTGPLIHGSWDHLINNSFPLLILGAGIFYFFRNIAWQVLIVSYLSPGFATWVAARPSFHIGISGVIYSLAFFVFFSGVFRKDVKSITLSLLTAFWYGSMVWGVLPGKQGISWEGHLFGAMTGIALAFYFRKAGPPKKKYSWEDEPESSPYDIIEPWNYKENMPPPEGFSYPD